MAKINFAGTVEEVVTRDEFPLSKAKEVLKNEVIGVIGYGVQGPGQSLNLKDNGFNVIVGQRKNSKSWEKALKDGWIEGENLFEIDEACRKATIIQYLLSDAGQIQVWPLIKEHLTENKTLYFSHGFGITFKDKTKIIPPKNIDVSLVAPKGAGNTVRDHFLRGSGINTSYAIYQDYTGTAKDKTLALAFAIGCGHSFETTFEKEVYSDLTGERCVLMGLIQGAFLAQ